MINPNYVASYNPHNYTYLKQQKQLQLHKKIYNKNLLHLCFDNTPKFGATVYVIIIF